jgi:hypothetical protein
MVPQIKSFSQIGKSSISISWKAPGAFSSGWIFPGGGDRQDKIKGREAYRIENPAAQFNA